MNVDEYVAARYGRLLERAVELGAEEGLAAEYVDQVLLDQRRAIVKADDPDPLVYDALERAVLRLPEPARSPWPFVGVGLAAIAVTVGVLLTQEPAASPMPSLFGSTGDQARERLEAAGYDVLLREVRECEPMGQVVNSDPQAGEPVADGATVSVFTAVPSGVQCEAEYGARADAWEFLDFTITGEREPAFARTVTIVIDGVEGEPRSGPGAAGSDRWREVRRLIADGAVRAAPSSTGLPLLTVTQGVPPDATCTIPRPVSAGDRPTLRLQVDARPPGEDLGCPLTIDLYRDSEQVIDGVVIYSAVDPS